MSWWAHLVNALTEDVRARPFAPRAIVTASGFAKQALRADLSEALAAHELPVSGLHFVTPHNLTDLFAKQGIMRSEAHLRLNLLAAFTDEPGLLGGLSPKPWRDQLRLAQALLQEDLEGVEDSVLHQTLSASPRLRSFVATIQRIAQATPGTSPLRAAEACTAPTMRTWSLPLPPLPLRVDALLRRLDPEDLSAPLSAGGWRHRATTKEQLAEGAVRGLVARGSARVAIILLDPDLEGPVQRALDREGQIWCSPRRQPPGFDEDLAWLARHELQDQPRPAPLSHWAAALQHGASDAITKALGQLASYGELVLPAGAVIDELKGQLGWDRPRLGWAHGRIHLLPASAWPDGAYDEVVFLGAQRGTLARALSDRTPLLTPDHRRQLQALNWSRFDPAEVTRRQDLWLRAWRCAAPQVVVGWVRQTPSGRPKVADRWAQCLAAELEEAPLQGRPHGDATPPPVAPVPWPGWAGRRWYPSRIENILSCPRRELLAKLLKLEAKEEERPWQRLSDNRWLGTLVHRVAQDAIEAILRGDAPMEDLVQQLQASTLHQLRSQEPPLSDGLIALLTPSMMLRFQPLIDRVRSGSITRFIRVEHTLIGTGPFDDLRARCDVVAHDAAGQEVLIDLKSGAAKSAADLHEAEAKGESVQRGVYLLTHPEANEAGMLYLNAGNNTYQGIDQDADQKAWATIALERARDHVQNGSFPGLPGGNTRPCAQCSMRSACRPFDETWRHQLEVDGPKHEGNLRAALKAQRAAQEDA